jgi:hypothetical protein
MDYVILPLVILYTGGCIMNTYEPWDNDRLDIILQAKTGACKIIRIGEVVGIRYKVMVKCLTHDYEWETSPQSLVNAVMCPMGVKEHKTGKHRKAKYKYSEVKAIVERQGYRLLSTEYRNNKEPITFYDVEHNTTITCSFRNFLSTYVKE